MTTKRLQAVATSAVCLLIASTVAIMQPAAGYPLEHIETVIVDSANAAGSNTATSLLAGRTYRFVASGTFNYHPGDFKADAECSNVNVDSLWTRDRYGPDLLDLLVDGTAPDWVPAIPSTETNSRRFALREVTGCQTLSDPLGRVQTHIYETYHTPQTTHSVNFKISDDPYFDNSGKLTVDVYDVTNQLGLAPRLFLGTVVVDAAKSTDSYPQNLAGVTPYAMPVMVPGRQYQLIVSGVYVYSYSLGQPSDQNFADAECSVRRGDLEWRTTRPQFSNVDSLDLLIAGTAVAWTPQFRNTSGCDAEGHTYQYFVTPQTPATVGFRINERASPNEFIDNAGSLFVQIFQLGG